MIKKIIVKNIVGTACKVFVYENNKKIKSFKGWIGKNGVAKNKVEGDAKTPLGTYKFLYAFGIAKKPSKCLLKYEKVTKSDEWVDDLDSKYYNKWVNTKKVKKTWKSAEILSDYPIQYKYAFVFDYNINPIVKGKGSAVFFHVIGKNPYTGGCVAVKEKNMLFLLSFVDKKTTITIEK